MEQGREIRLAREIGEASLVRVARNARLEGVWVYADGVFRDVTTRHGATAASFVLRVEQKSPFTVYHIHPGHVRSPGGWIDRHGDYKISPPSLEDLISFQRIRKKYGELGTCKVADGWGLWSYALSEEVLACGLLRRLNSGLIFRWIRDAYVRHYRFRLRVSAGARRRFQEELASKGILLSYDTLEELDERARTATCDRG